MTRIRTDQTETVEAFCLDSSGRPLTGLTNIFLSVRRTSDNLIYDWNDYTFRAGIACTSPRILMTEIDSVFSPGYYQLSGGFDTSLIANHTSNEQYQLTVAQEGLPQNADNVPQIGEIVEGDYLDEIDLLRKDITNRKDLAPGKTDNWVLYDDDSTTPILTWDVSDQYSREIQIAERVPARRTKAH